MEKEFIWPKKFLYYMVMTIFLYVIIESCSYFVYYFMHNQLFSYSRTINYAENVAKINKESRKSIQLACPPEPEVLHPYLGYVFNPEINSDQFIKENKYSVTEYGFMDSRPPFLRRSKDKVIVGIFGGSVAYWFSVLGIDFAISELEKTPQFSGKKIVPVRIALGGYKQPQQLMTLNYLLALGAEFDIIINIDGFNEVALPISENLPKHVSIIYPRTWFEFTQNINDPNLLSILGDINYLKKKKNNMATLFTNTIFRHTVTAGLLFETYDQYLSSLIYRDQMKFQRYQTNMQNMSYVTSGPSKYYQRESQVYSDLASLWANSSLQMFKLCTANKIKYFHFLQPNQYVPGSKIMGKEEKRLAFDPNHPYRTGVIKGYPYLIESSEKLTQEGVDFFNLSMVFARNADVLYADQCCHFNEKGNELLGRIIGEDIAARLKSNQ